MKHYRKTFLQYEKHGKTDHAEKIACAFCDNVPSSEIIEQTDTVFVIKNRVKYDMFDGVRVLDHLMVIPIAHRESLAEFTDQEALDMVRISGKYEEEGYGVYARGKGAVTRSVAHQHTHLMKLAATPAKLIIYARKPYLLIDR
jgi:diadenosine tetraphosphate (Ap4A) HIT family hydrolase